MADKTRQPPARDLPPQARVGDVAAVVNRYEIPGFRYHTWVEAPGLASGEFTTPEPDLESLEEVAREAIESDTGEGPERVEESRTTARAGDGGRAPGSPAAALQSVSPSRERSLERDPDPVPVRAPAARAAVEPSSKKGGAELDGAWFREPSPEDERSGAGQGFEPVLTGQPASGLSSALVVRLFGRKAAMSGATGAASGASPDGGSPTRAPEPSQPVLGGAALIPPPVQTLNWEEPEDLKDGPLPLLQQMQHLDVLVEALLSQQREPVVASVRTTAGGRAARDSAGVSSERSSAGTTANPPSQSRAADRPFAPPTAPLAEPPVAPPAQEPRDPVYRAPIRRPVVEGAGVVSVMVESEGPVIAPNATELIYPPLPGEFRIEKVPGIDGPREPGELASAEEVRPETPGDDDTGGGARSARERLRQIALKGGSQ